MKSDRSNYYKRDFRRTRSWRRRHKEPCDLRDPSGAQARAQAEATAGPRRPVQFESRTTRTQERRGV